ncbi:MAG: winged helix-turn-helix domain-containing protein [Bryobacteraceae bacterium]|nr:winged helix-turn-helix domain-containing protein [Bryobacterales bacterium]NUN02981.1 winged helix-turn-helix domain-containing protein [Bryobacteraceae bacterium]
MTYDFGPFRYDAEQRLLFRAGEIVPLVPKAADTLHVLLERRGRIVEKAELMKLVWPGTNVEDVGLARNISLLRKALEDESEANPYIETIPRRGYRFAAPVSTPGLPGARPPALRWHAYRRWLILLLCVLGLGGFVHYQFYVPSRYLPDGGRSANLAVAPFECLCPGMDGDGFSQGFNEVLAASLSKLNGVQVVSPGTVRRYQRAGFSMALMGRLLGLEVLVEGTIQKLGDRLRTSVRLVDVRSGKLIWAEIYDESAADPGIAQKNMALAIAREAGARLSVSR